MPVQQTTTPYDNLATVTQLTRTVLGDFVQNQNPNLAGMVNTNGTIVTLLSGSPFTALLNGLLITIAGIQYPVLSVTGLTTLVLSVSAGVQNNVSFAAAIPLGDIFADSQAYVLPTINLAWRKVQKKLADVGHPRMKKEVDIFSIPVVTNQDPFSQQSISWTQFFDGTNFQSPPSAPVLPQDFISPLKLWERPSGMTVELHPMHPAGDSLKSRNKCSWNRMFDWREDAIYFPGSLLLMDMRISYSSFLPDIVVVQNSFAMTPVPIMRSADALAFYSAAIFATPRGGEMVAAGFEAKGDAAVDQITNSWEKLQQRSSFHRRAWGERGRRSYLYGR